MTRHRKITAILQRRIATRQLAGEELANIAEDLDIHPVSLSRLQGDASYQRILDDLEKTAHETARRKISTAVSRAIDTLSNVCEMSSENETLTECSMRVDANDKPVKVEKRTVRDDPRKLLAKVQAASKLLDCYLHLSNANDGTDYTEQLFSQREKLLSRYGIKPINSLESIPHNETTERETDSTRVSPHAEERTLSEMLSSLFPEKRLN